jgi:hypothetical protein
VQPTAEDAKLASMNRMILPLLLLSCLTFDGGCASERSHSVACGMGTPNAISNAIGYAKFRSRSHDAVIRVYHEAGNVIETHEQAVALMEWRARFVAAPVAW